MDFLIPGKSVSLSDQKILFIQTGLKRIKTCSNKKYFAIKVSF